MTGVTGNLFWPCQFAKWPFLLLCFLIVFGSDLEARTVSHWFSDSEWGEPQTAFSGEMPEVWVQLEPVSPSFFSENVQYDFRWIRPDGAREQDLGTDIAFKRRREGGLITGLSAKMAIDGLDRAPGLWTVEIHESGICPPDCTIDNLLSAASFTLEPVQGPGPLVFDFPTILAGAGNRTDVYATALCDPAGPPPSIEATFFDQNGEVIETQEQDGICNGTVVLPFTGANDLVFGHNRVQINPPVQDSILIEIVSLNLEGAAPLGVSISEQCSEARFTVIRNDELNAAIAVSTTGPDPLNCAFRIWSAEGILMGQGDFEVPALGQHQFFVSEQTVLPDVFTGWGDITCDAPAYIISFFQTNLGGLTTNPVDCQIPGDLGEASPRVRLGLNRGQNSQNRGWPRSRQRRSLISFCAVLSRASRQS